MDKHSPGPWYPDGVGIRSAEDALIATALTLPDRATGNELANARLIAAAPDLLTACGLLVQVLENAREMAAGASEVIRDFGIDGASEALEAAAEAIKKVEGR